MTESGRGFQLGVFVLRGCTSIPTVLKWRRMMGSTCRKWASPPCARARRSLAARCQNLALMARRSHSKSPRLFKVLRLRRLLMEKPQ